VNSEEIKNEFINCIEGTHTLNLAISILEERDLYHSIIKEVRECLNKNRIYITGERNLAFEIEEILDKVEEKK
jgi:hypothetical protein